MIIRNAAFLGLPLLTGVWIGLAQAGFADPVPVRPTERPTERPAGRPADLTTAKPPVKAPGTGVVTPQPAPARQESPATVAPQQKPAVVAAPAPTTPPETEFSWAESVAIQSALVWLGVYDGRADGVLGTGSGAAVASWQQSAGLPATGILSEAQAKQLIRAAAAGRASVGMERVTDAASGIRLDLPLGLVAFDRYAPPFVQYGPKDGSGVTAMLISRSGDRGALAGLYNVLQSLPMFKGAGERMLELYSFTLSSQSESTHSYAQAAVAGGRITGFALSWPATDDVRMAKVLATMKATFAAPGDKVLDPGLGAALSVARDDLTSGLTPEKAVFWHSGMYISPEGAVLTVADGLQSCGKVTIGTASAQIAFHDATLAVLTPDTPITPREMARFASGPAPTAGEIVVAGFPYPRAMATPSVTFGTISGSANDRLRLSVPAHGGNVGGPVLDQQGTVRAMVLPADPGGPEDGTAATALGHIADTLSGQDFAPERADAGAVLSDAELSRRATAMTVRIGCWN